MPIKIEGLCGVTISNSKLYLLLPNFKLRKASTVDGSKNLEPHFPRVLLEYDSLDNNSKKKIQYVVSKKDLAGVAKNYGLVLLDHEGIGLTLTGSNLNENGVRAKFVDMAKVYSTSQNDVKLPKALLENDIKNPINGVDLACRVIIDKGKLEAEEETTDQYSFDHAASDQDHQTKRKFCSFLSVDATVTKITIGNKDYTFTQSPIVHIENLPFVREEPANGTKDFDFELAYQLTPTIAEKRLPTFHKKPSAKPIICSLAWFDAT